MKEEDTKIFTLDGEPIHIDEFIYDNELSSEDILYITILEVDDTIEYGGGAAPLRTLKRIR